MWCGVYGVCECEQLGRFWSRKYLQPADEIEEISRVVREESGLTECLFLLLWDAGCSMCNICSMCGRGEYMVEERVGRECNGTK